MKAENIRLNSLCTGSNWSNSIMKNIALIITRMISGGASTVARQIIEGAALREKGKYKFTLFTGIEDLNENLIDELSEYCTIIKIPYLIRNISPLKDYKAYRSLICELRKEDFDVVHTHTSKAGFIGRLAAAKAQIPIIIHSPHGTIYHSNSNIEGVPESSFGQKILQTAERFAGGKTTYLTTLSQNEKEICVKLGLSEDENTVIVPNGINCKHFALSDVEKRNARNELEILDDAAVLLSVGRLSPEKGHVILIDAFAEAVQKTADCEKISSMKLILLGDGTERDALVQQCKKLGLQTDASIENEIFKTVEPVVLFAGHCCDIRRYLAVADAVIIPSLYEGFGIAVIEAMAASLPVIASDVGGIPEIITDNQNGILVEAGNSEKLAESITELLTDPKKMRNLAKAALLRSYDFSEENMLDNYFKLYDTVRK